MGFLSKAFKGVKNIAKKALPYAGLAGAGYLGYSALSSANSIPGAVPGPHSQGPSFNWGGLGNLAGGLAPSLIGGAASAYGAHTQQEASKDMANKQMDFQASQAKRNREFGADSASIARDYQTNMSNTAVRRNVTDMKAAGLNPILAAGGGASTPSSPSPTQSTSPGAQGQAQNIAGTGISSALSLLRSSAEIQNLQANTNLTQKKTNPVEFLYSIAESLGIPIKKLKELGITSAKDYLESDDSILNLTDPKQKKLDIMKKSRKHGYGLKVSPQPWHSRKR
nr:MAG: DNA pilot protein [Microvirus sp.]